MRLSLSGGNWLPVLRSVPDVNCVALTFDDGPTPETTPAILAALAHRQAKATFFLSGVRLAQRMRLAESIVAHGHAVFAHGWEHVALETKPANRIVEDLSRAEQLLATLRPTPSPYLVRLPYNSGFRKPRVHRAIRAWRADAQLVHWRLSLEDVTIARDCRAGIPLGQAIASRISAVMESPARGGAILLLHEQPFDIEPLETPVAPLLTEHLLMALQAAGLRAAPLVPRQGHPVLSRFLLI